MFEFQYELQKSLQNPKVVNYSDAELGSIQENIQTTDNAIAHDNITTFTQPTANASEATIPQHRLPHQSNTSSGLSSNQEISIVEGSINPNTEVFYDPSAVTVKRGSSVVWTNNDPIPHTATSGNPDNLQAPSGALFDTGILGPGRTSEVFTINAEAGTFDYYCTLHPYMRGQLIVED
jgi:nitrite reductase (NO-forming)